MMASNTLFSVGQQVALKGHFDHPILLEEVRPLGGGLECRVRLSDGSLDEIVISREEASALVGQTNHQATAVVPVDAETLRFVSLPLGGAPMQQND